MICMYESIAPMSLVTGKTRSMSRSHVKIENLAAGMWSTIVATSALTPSRRGKRSGP